MRTSAQIEASRRNGARSRGPVTPEGKARSSANAVKHGINSCIVVLNNESREAFEGLLRQLLDEYQPETDHQVALVDDLAACTWRLHRILALETAAIDHEVDRQRAELERSVESMDQATRTCLAVAALTTDGRALAWYGRQESRLRRAIREARKELAASKAAAPAANDSGDSTPAPEPETEKMSKGTQAQPVAAPCGAPAQFALLSAGERNPERAPIAQPPLQDQDSRQSPPCSSTVITTEARPALVS